MASKRPAPQKTAAKRANTKKKAPERPAPANSTAKPTTTRNKRAFEDRHASTQAYIEYMRPRCVDLSRVLKKTGSFYYHCDWHTVGATSHKDL